MTDQTIWLSILSSLIGLLILIGGWFCKTVWGKVSELESTSQNTQLAAFLGGYEEWKRGITRWQDVADRRLDEKKATLKDHEHRITRLERNGHA